MNYKLNFLRSAEKAKLVQERHSDSCFFLTPSLRKFLTLIIQMRTLKRIRVKLK